MTVLRPTCQCDPMGEGIREHNSWCPVPELQARPVLLLDVDGVISAWGNGSVDRPLEDWAFYTRYQRGGQTIYIGLRVPHGVKERLDRLRDVFDVWWCTGWEEHASQLLHPYLGSHVQHWPVIKWPNKIEATHTACNWKLDTLTHVLGQRPAAWLDDNIGPEARLWAGHRTGRGCPTAVVKTESDVCLQDEHVERLLDWAAGLTKGTA